MQSGKAAAPSSKKRRGFELETKVPSRRAIGHAVVCSWKHGAALAILHRLQGPFIGLPERALWGSDDQGEMRGDAVVRFPWCSVSRVLLTTHASYALRVTIESSGNMGTADSSKIFVF